jgi:predicted nuclease of predicted toxin-antitoxin system
VKFIVDAQLPKALSEFLNSKGLDSIHTLELPEQNATSDEQINRLADQENRVLISKDDDFLKTFLIRSEPKKLIMVKTGNISNKMLIQIFKKSLDILLEMLSRSNLIELNKNDIIEHE